MREDGEWGGEARGGEGREALRRGERKERCLHKGTRLGFSCWRPPCQARSATISLKPRDSWPPWSAAPVLTTAGLPRAATTPSCTHTHQIQVLIIITTGARTTMIIIISSIACRRFDNAGCVIFHIYARVA